MEKFTIKRSEWLRGEGDMVSMLYRPRDGKRCCVGFYGLSRGYSDEDLCSSANTTNVIDEHAENLWPDWTQEISFETKTSDIDELYRINDMVFIFNEEEREEEREKIIKTIFAKHDVEVEFID